jgi:hypothetical protein
MTAFFELLTTAGMVFVALLARFALLLLAFGVVAVPVLVVAAGVRRAHRRHLGRAH